MSEEQPQAAPTATEETPAETPAATTDDQPAVTEVTEVTTEGEPEAAPKEEPPKEEEPAKKEEPKEGMSERLFELTAIALPPTLLLFCALTNRSKGEADASTC